MACDLTDDQKVDFARRFTESFLAGDAEAVEPLLAKDFSLFINTGQWLTRADMLHHVATFFPSLRSISYADVRRFPTPSGWVQQHVVNTEWGDGTRVTDLHVCLVATMDGERLVHIDEYMDGSGLPRA
jgi:hypothetical protein